MFVIEIYWKFPCFFQKFLGLVGIGDSKKTSTPAGTNNKNSAVKAREHSKKPTYDRKVYARKQAEKKVNP